MTKINFGIDRYPLNSRVITRDDFRYYSYKIISRKRRFIYFEYPKTGSNSIKGTIFPLLLKEYKGVVPYSIYKARRLFKTGVGLQTSLWPYGSKGDVFWRKIFPEAHLVENGENIDLEKYFVFSAVRNPFDKMVSAYTHGAWGIVDKNEESFTDFIRSLLPGNSRELKDLTDRGKNHFVPWTTMFDIEKTDIVMRMETFSADFQKVMEKVGIKASLPAENKSNRDRDYRGYYTPETREIVTELYKKDLDVFGYQF